MNFSVNKWNVARAEFQALQIPLMP